jgi:glycosyltransferase involved in cell wall biosynthesis
MELALSGAAPFDQLRQNGWRVVDGYEKSSTVDVYQGYLGSSRGEWSIAKHAYVASRSGWFSERTAAYLALGKPVVVQDTGFRPYYPIGEGLFDFTNLDEATAAIESIESNYRRHCEAARSIAESHFAAGTVLTRLLQQVGL